MGFVGAAVVAAAADVAAAALSSLSSLSSHLICSRWIVPNWFEFGMCQIFVLCFDMRCFHIGRCSHRVLLLGSCSSLTCSNRLLESNRNICHLPCIPAQTKTIC